MFGKFSAIFISFIFAIASLQISSGQGQYDDLLIALYGINSCDPPRVCVNRNLCENGVLIEDANSIVMFRSLRSQCQNILDVCCSPGSDKTEEKQPEKSEEQWRDCGYRNIDGYGFHIVGRPPSETSTHLGEFPWMVGVMSEGKIIGGGSLIAPNVILSAGEKIRMALGDNLTIVAGEWDLDNRDELFPHQDRHIKEIIIHENLKKDPNSPGVYNIALLVLNKPFEAFQHISTICLPPEDYSFINASCFVTGWGRGKTSRGGLPVRSLKKIDLTVISNEQCEQNLRDNTFLGKFPRFYIHSSSLCAGGEKDKDACYGDGGAPLVCQIPGSNNRFYQAGIVSWGVECGVENVPGVYANVTHLRPWIMSKLRERNIDSSYFTV